MGGFMCVCWFVLPRRAFSLSLFYENSAVSAAQWPTAPHLALGAGTVHANWNSIGCAPCPSSVPFQLSRRPRIPSVYKRHLFSAVHRDICFSWAAAKLCDISSHNRSSLPDLSQHSGTGRHAPIRSYRCRSALTTLFCKRVPMHASASPVQRAR